MKKFKYRLQPLLKVREHKEKEQQKELAQALGKVATQKEELDELLSHRSETVDDQRARMSGTITVADLLVCSRFLLHLKKSTIVGREVLRGLEAEADKSRMRLVEAAKERKIYEKHKEKLKEKYFEEMKLIENKEMDEIASNICRRQGSVL